MGAKKSKQSLARRDVPSGGMYGGAGDQADYAERSSDQPATAATETAAAVETEDTARESVPAETGRMDTEEAVVLDHPRRLELIKLRARGQTTAEEDAELEGLTGAAYQSRHPVTVPVPREYAPPTETEIKPKRYTPPNCSACTALRPKPSDSYVSVYHTKREGDHVFRYCKCGFCGNTFKDAEAV